MKVFISWSGDTSFHIAKILKEWIPCVIQDIEPYFSSSDIDKGARWSTDIAKELESASFGILCVTKDNIDSSWLNFEAGALSKAIDKAKVCPLLFGLKPTDISNSPILQFQMTNINRDEIFQLFVSMNRCLDDNALPDTRLKKSFELAWNEIDVALKQIEVKPQPIKNKINNDDQIIILEEMLNLLRSQQLLLRSPEDLLPRQYLSNILSKQYPTRRINPKAIFDCNELGDFIRNSLCDDKYDLNSPEFKEKLKKYDIAISYITDRLENKEFSRWNEDRIKNKEDVVFAY